ncbi:hypothetical protein SADUNF_Sadunf11G0102200 [Salix dunnii]|uniref:RING-type domain-containing protein n=1 Tax=Salix dunnii TaxID=1413687 RepID=A0A835MQR2_9ROSI|nr:hypothetical protein SADUNF_Sadunf11G0102200 [Salix dunnii]
MKRWFSLWGFAAKLQGFGAGVFIRVLKTSIIAASACFFVLDDEVLFSPSEMHDLVHECKLARSTKSPAYLFVTFIGGALVGSIIGAMEGQTTETGFLRGSGEGAIAGAITCVQLLESMINGEPLSKVALLHSLLNAKAYTEWAGPALLEAYQCQVTAILETTYREISDIYDTSRVSGLSEDCIRKLPEFTYQSDNKIVVQCCPEFCCSICLQDLKDWDSVRKLPYCEHYFHLECIDEWLARNGSCPICRNYVSSIDNDTVQY